MNIYEFLLIAIALLLAAGVYLLERRERRELLNRFMAKDYKEYNYYEGEHKKDVKEKVKISKEARDERDVFREKQKMEEEIAEIQGGKKDEPKLIDFEEDFKEEE